MRAATGVAGKRQEGRCCWSATPPLFSPSASFGPTPMRLRPRSGRGAHRVVGMLRAVLLRGAIAGLPAAARQRPRGEAHEEDGRGRTGGDPGAPCSRGGRRGLRRQKVTRRLESARAEVVVTLSRRQPLWLSRRDGRHGDAASALRPGCGRQPLQLSGRREGRSTGPRSAPVHDRRGRCLSGSPYPCLLPRRCA